MIQQNTRSATSTPGVQGGPGDWKVRSWGGRELLGWQDIGPATNKPATQAGAPATRPDRNGKSTTYAVQPGDSLWAIAARVLGDGARYREIASLNKLQDPSSIRPGQKLRLPGTSKSDNAAPAATTTTPDRPASPKANKEKPRTYEVKSGDTLWEIAAAVLGDGARWRELERLNRIEDPRRLATGTVLKVPT